MKIDLNALLFPAPSHIIIKMRDNFPDYDVGQDIDLVALNTKEMIDYIKGSMRDNDLRVKKKPGDHYHVDFMDGDSIHLRLDIYGEFISEEFTNDLWKFQDPTLPMPDEIFEGIIKCWEFLKNKKRKYSKYITFKKFLDVYTY